MFFQPIFCGSDDEVSIDRVIDHYIKKNTKKNPITVLLLVSISNAIYFENHEKHILRVDSLWIKYRQCSLRIAHICQSSTSAYICAVIFSFLVCRTKHA